MRSSNRVTAMPSDYQGSAEERVLGAEKSTQSSMHSAEERVLSAEDSAQSSMLSPRHSIALPAPRAAITIRTGRMDDLPFIDALQRKHTKQVGWFPTKTIEGKINAGHVLIAE